MSLNLEKATELIIERSRQLVNQLIENRGHDKPPFLSEEFARLLGVRNIVKTDLGKTSGVLLRFHDGPVIQVNKNHNLARQNFSCAHEIGHILFSELKLDNYIQNIEYRTFNPQAHANSRIVARERLCHATATELLMPETIFKKHLLVLGASINSIERLANIFRVSIMATAWRIAEISSEPCITLIWQPLLRTRALRLVWCVGPGINITNKSNYVPVHTKVKYPSILHKAYEQNNTFKCYKKFKFGKDTKGLPIESKGFGRGENRYVVSLAYPER